ncbi:MAG: patatin-like phospholipase family protein [Deltaproteobacteria bacterium]|nr:patatin-like phospholipase family protein [Deltaproteobacteria bacterium]
MIAAEKKSHQELCSFLEKIPFFSAVPRDQLERISRFFKPRFARKGRVLCREGDAGDAMYVIKTGSVGVFVERGGAEAFVTYLHRGDFFGELALLSGTRRMATVRVLLDAELYELDRDAFMRLMEENPAVALYLSRHYAYRFAQSTHQVLKEPLPGLFAVTSTHEGLGRSHLLYSLCHHLVAEAGKDVLVVDLNPGPPGRLEGFGIRPAACPSQDLLQVLAEGSLVFLEDCWCHHPSGFEVLRVFASHGSDDTLRALEEHVSLFMDALRKHFQMVFFNVGSDGGFLGEEILRLSDRILLLINNTRQELGRVRARLAYLKDLSHGRLDHIKVGVSHLAGERGLPRVLLKKELGVPETPAVWVDRTPAALASRLDTEKSFPVRGPRALARELGGVRVGLALGAGGARGWAHLGVLKILEEEGVHVDMIAGASMGALVGAFYARTGSVSRTVSLTVDQMPTRLQARRKIFDYTLPVHGIIRGGRLQRLMREALGNADFLDLLIPTFVVAVDIDTGEEVLLERGNVSEAVRASISIPGIFNPARLDGRWLVDGGLLNPVPVDVLVQKGADFILAVCIEHEKGRRTRKRHGAPRLLGVLSRTINIMHARAAADYAQKADLILYPQVSRFAWDDFHRGRALMRAGEEACGDRIDEIKRLLSRKTSGA